MQFGGEGRGPKPKGLTLASLAGCTAMDVQAILGKMRVETTAFHVDAAAELTEEHPKRFVSATLRYYFEGEDLPLPKLRRAVMLSEERYCGVRATLAPSVDIRSEIYVNGERMPGVNEEPASTTPTPTASSAPSSAAPS